MFLPAVPRTARLSRSQRAVKPCRCVRRKGVVPNATAKIVVLSGSTVSTLWKRWWRQKKEKYKNGRAMKFAGCRSWKRRERKRRKGKEEDIFALYDCRESLAYFTSPRKLLSLHCSRSLIIDFHVHRHKDTNDDGRGAMGKRGGDVTREGCSSYALISMVALQLP